MNVAENTRMQNFISWIKYGQGTLPHCICGECERSMNVRRINVGDLVEIPTSELFSGFTWTVIDIKRDVYMLRLQGFNNGIRITKELPECDLTFVK